MKRLHLCICGLALAFLMFPVAAEGQPVPCGARDAVVAQLGDKYGETRRGAGLSGPSAIFEIFASEQTGSWTLLRTGTNGLSCVIAVGEGWQSEPVPLTPVGDPA